MAHNYYQWHCKWCGKSDGALDWEPLHDRFKCLLCLRTESSESTLARNVKVTVENPQYLKEGQVYAISPEFLRLALP